MNPEFLSIHARNIAAFLLSGLVLRMLGDGHWTDWTKPVEKPHLRIALRILSWVMFLYAFMLLAGIIVGPAWAMFFCFAVVLYHMTFNGEL